MTNSNNDIEELEELLTELEGQEAQLVTPYAEDDDAVTQLMDAPLGDQEWMVQVTALDRRMMSTAQLLSELQTGKVVSSKTLVWRGGMDDWMPVANVDELAQASRQPSSPAPRMALGGLPLGSLPLGNLLPPPPAPLPSQPVWSRASSRPLAPPPPAHGSSPAALSSSSAVLASSSGLGLPSSSPLGSPRPLPAPLPPVPHVVPHVAQTHTTRPVAVDFSDIRPENSSPIQGKRALVALSAVAILAACVTVYTLFSGEDSTAAEATDTAAQPQAVSALQPASAAEKTPEASPAAEVKGEPVAAASGSTEDQGSSDTAGGIGSLRQANVAARYSPRSSEYRRRAKSSSAQSSSSTEKASESNSQAAAEEPKSRAAASENEASDEIAAAPADDDADSPEAPKSSGKPGSTFNRDAAKAALDDAASQAKLCRPQGGPSGTGRVQVRYEPSGKVGAVSILTSKFENTTTGSCVKMLFRRAKVPEFTGAPVVVVNKSFEIP